MDHDTAFIVATGKVIRQHREQRRLSIAELASKARVSPFRLKRIEQGSLDPLVREFILIAIALNTPSDRLMERIEQVVKELLHG